MQQYLFMEIKFIDFWENPANTSITPTHQDPELVKLLKQPQPTNEKQHHSVVVIYNLLS